MGIKSIEDHEAGLTWVMDDAMQRASHALAARSRSDIPRLLLSIPGALRGR